MPGSSSTPRFEVFLKVDSSRNHTLFHASIRRILGSFASTRHYRVAWDVGEHKSFSIIHVISLYTSASLSFYPQYFCASFSLDAKGNTRYSRVETVYLISIFKYFVHESGYTASQLSLLIMVACLMVSRPKTMRERRVVKLVLCSDVCLTMDSGDVKYWLSGSFPITYTSAAFSPKMPHDRRYVINQKHILIYYTQRIRLNWSHIFCSVR